MPEKCYAIPMKQWHAYKFKRKQVICGMNNANEKKHIPTT